jgi:hypothetical protein
MHAAATKVSAGSALGRAFFVSSANFFSSEQAMTTKRAVKAGVRFCRCGAKDTEHCRTAEMAYVDRWHSQDAYIGLPLICVASIRRIEATHFRLPATLASLPGFNQSRKK